MIDLGSPVQKEAEVVHPDSDADRRHPVPVETNIQPPPCVRVKENNSSTAATLCQKMAKVVNLNLPLDE